jgi:3-oxoadipate enol-lactonase
MIIELGSDRFNVQVDGPVDAPAIVLSNSLGTTLAMWEPQMRALASRFRVVRYDQRGHGASANAVGDYGVDTLGRDVVGILDALKIRRARFCGISMGGATGMWLALHAPDRIEKLVLANTATKFGTPERWNARIDAVTRAGMAAIADGVIAIWFTADFRAREPAAVARVRQMLLDSPVEGYLAACRAVRGIDLTAEVGRVTHPTLVIAGTHDTSTPPAQGRAIAERIVRARFVELPAAHISNIEAAEAFTAEVLDLLGDDDR